MYQYQWQQATPLSMMLPPADTMFIFSLLNISLVNVAKRLDLCLVQVGSCRFKVADFGAGASSLVGTLSVHGVILL